MIDSRAISLHIQDRPPSHASSPLTQDKTDSHAASPPIQDRLDSHASSPLIQEMADSHAASPPVKDRFPSHASSPLVPDRSNTQVGQQSQLLFLTPSNADTCKILDVHLAFNKRRDTSSISKPLDNTKGMKFYFKPVKKSKPDHSFPFVEDQPQPFSSALNTPLIQDQPPFQVDSPGSHSQVHSPVTRTNHIFL